MLLFAPLSSIEPEGPVAVLDARQQHRAATSGSPTAACSSAGSLGGESLSGRQTPGRQACRPVFAPSRRSALLSGTEPPSSASRRCFPRSAQTCRYLMLKFQQFTLLLNLQGSLVFGQLCRHLEPRLHWFASRGRRSPLQGFVNPGLSRDETAEL